MTGFWILGGLGVLILIEYACIDRAAKRAFKRGSTAQRSMSLPNEYYALLNRLNQGNPNYTPYRGGEKKS